MLRKSKLFKIIFLLTMVGALSACNKDKNTDLEDVFITDMPNEEVEDNEENNKEIKKEDRVETPKENKVKRNLDLDLRVTLDNNELYDIDEETKNEILALLREYTEFVYDCDYENVKESYPDGSAEKLTVDMTTEDERNITLQKKIKSQFQGMVTYELQKIQGHDVYRALCFTKTDFESTEIPKGIYYANSEYTIVKTEQGFKIANAINHGFHEADKLDAHRNEYGDVVLDPMINEENNKSTTDHLKSNDF